MQNNGRIAHDVAAARLADAMRLFVGPGQRFTTPATAAASGVSERSIDQYRAGEATPGLAGFLSLCRVLPPEFANMNLELAGLTGARPIEGALLTPHKLLAEMTEHAAQLAQRLADGTFCHQDRAATRKLLPQLIATLAAFNASLGDE